MRTLRLFLFSLTLLGVLGSLNPIMAQQGTLTGRVTDAETGQLLDGAQITIQGSGQDTGTISNAQGVFSIPLPPGTYALVVEFLGHVTERFEGIRVTSGQATTYDIQLRSTALALNELVVTASRGVEEKLVEAPAQVHLVGPTQVQERMVATPVEHIRTAPGVDIIQHGIQATNVVVRGFNNIFSGSLHALTDHRLAGVPSLRVNLLHFIPANNEDIDRMEVVLGPGSALYGPNTANGVLHIMTRSPLDSASTGTSVSLGGGSQSVFQGSFRSSFLVNRNLGIKLSGQYLRGNEWEYDDLGEQAARAKAETDPDGCVAIIGLHGIGPQEAAEACRRIGVRDFDLKRFGIEARADYRFAEDGTAIFTYGRTGAWGIELTGLGAGQTEGWTYEFFQGRMNKGRFFAQAYLNTSDAGEGTFLLKSGIPLVDKSKLMVFQAQHGFSLLDGRQDFTYGIDLFGTRPETEGTINGTYDTKDDMDEWGVYLQSKTALSPKVDLVLAGRVDDHSMLPEKVYSPRAALVFKPTENQSFRATYNRAFSTPTSLNFFLDISAGLAPNDALAALGYTLRAFGTGKDGYSFQNADGSLRGIRSPFAPGEFVDGTAAGMWGLAVNALQGMGQIDAETAALLGSLPVVDEALTIGRFNPDGSPFALGTIPDVPGIRESYTETLEAGWQGILENKIRISASVYKTKKSDFISPLLVQNPLLQLSGDEVHTFLQTTPIPGYGIPVPALLSLQFQQMGLDKPTADAQAAATVAALAGGIGQIPLGVAASPDIPSPFPDLIVTYRNLGEIDWWGVDLGLEWFLDDKFTLSGSYSHVSEDWFEVAQGDPVSLNSPKDKGTIGLAFRNPKTGFSAEVRGRFTAEFPAESAGYTGTECRTDTQGILFAESCVASSKLVDVNLGYKIPNFPAELQLSVTNLFDEPYRSFVGVPEIGRFAMVRMKYDLF